MDQMWDLTTNAMWYTAVHSCSLVFLHSPAQLGKCRLKEMFMVRKLVIRVSYFTQPLNLTFSTDIVSCHGVACLCGIMLLMKFVVHAALLVRLHIFDTVPSDNICSLQVGGQSVAAQQLPML